MAGRVKHQGYNGGIMEGLLGIFFNIFCYLWLV